MAKQQASPYKFQYAVKFICTSDIPGTSQQSPGLLPGNYQTAVNIHNPNKTAVRLRKKLATVGVISKWLESGLKYDEVEQVHCGHVQDFEIITIHGFEGFLVIESTQSLDVVAVYTAAPIGGQVSSIEVEQIRERKIG
ncbi:MAG: hypothetical protein SFU99_01935 [Saprospiraceae bacterium]|nr:hypothetical protein [Saprospiraceae bacterium]